ncbi:MAG: hypothetical protein ABL934_09905 [Lysobacteraceae bacterium]
MSRRKVLLMELGVGGLPTTTAPLQILSTWVPAVYTPPPLPTPTGLAVRAIDLASVLTFTPTANTLTVIESAPNLGGTPGAWVFAAQTGDGTYTLQLSPGTPRWVRIKAVRNARSSGYSAELLASADSNRVRVAIQDTVNVSGLERVGVGIAGSNIQVGGFDNLPTTLSGSATSYWTGLSVSYTSTSSGTATVSVSAATVNRGSLSVSYSASTLNLTGLATGNNLIYLYYIDANSTGGAKTLNFTTAGVNLANANGIQSIASLVINIPASGSGTGGGSIGDGGGLRPIPPGGSIP